MAAGEVFVVHDAYDVAQASDGRSLYRAYLAQNVRRFGDEDGQPTVVSAEFAAAAFVVASSPIMSPPYVGTHPRVVFAAPGRDEDRRCGLLIELAAPLPSGIADRLPHDVVGWQRDDGDGRFRPPQGNERPAAPSRLTVRIPLPVDLLPLPAYTDTGVADVYTAKRAVRALTTHANSVLTHLVTSLDAGEDEHALPWEWMGLGGPVAGDGEEAGRPKRMTMIIRAEHGPQLGLDGWRNPRSR